MAMEKTIENNIRKQWEDAGGVVYKNHGGAYTKKGVPDLTGVLKGIYVALEVKAPNGDPKPVQLRHLQEIADADGVAAIIFDAKGFDYVKQAVDAERTVSIMRPHAYTLPKEKDDYTIPFTSYFWNYVKEREADKGVVFIRKHGRESVDVGLRYAIANKSSDSIIM